MNNLPLLFVASIFFLGCTEHQTSTARIKIDSGKGNHTTAWQSGTGADQTSEIVVRGDSNFAAVVQQNSTPEKSAPPGISDGWLPGVNALLVLLVSLGTLIGFIWKARPYVKRWLR